MSVEPLRVGGWLVTIGASLALVGAAWPPYKQWYSALAEALRVIATHLIGWLMIHLGFLSGTIVAGWTAITIGIVGAPIVSLTGPWVVYAVLLCIGVGVLKG
jgi:hypothetical protein